MGSKAADEDEELYNEITSLTGQHQLDCEEAMHGSCLLAFDVQLFKFLFLRLLLPASRSKSSSAR